MKSLYKFIMVFIVSLFIIPLTSSVKADTFNAYVVSGDMSGTYDSLKQATDAINLDGGITYTITLMADDDTMTTTATINLGKSITLKSTGSSPFAIKKTVNGRHINNNGKLIIENITLDSNGFIGGIMVSQGELTMNEGASVINGVLTGSSDPLGGGIGLFESRFTMNGGLIENNSARRGGGVDVGTSSTFEMNGGTIKGNRATQHGGGGIGIYVLGTFIMNDGEITENVSSTYGGGAYAAQATHVSTEPNDWCKIIINNGDIHNNEANYGGGLAAQYNGNITMHDGAVYDNHATSYGGGVLVNNSIYENEGVFFDLKNGSIYGNTTDGYGGGILVMDNSSGYTSTVTIGEATGNTIPLIYSNSSELHGGGGIMLVSNYSGSYAKIHNGHIYDNHANNGTGGGIALHGGSHLTIHNATIGGDGSDEGNTAIRGGGIGTFVGTSETTIEKVTIENNEAIINGGGIYLEKVPTLEILDDTSIISNTAGNEGGAIYTADFTDYMNLISSDYQNLQLGSKTRFSNNTANNAYLPPAIATSYTNIQYATSSISSNGGYLNPINNYDINYVNPPALALYTIVYDANGGSGNYESDQIVGEAYTVLGATQTDIHRDGFTFKGWSASATGSIEYLGGETLTQVLAEGETLTLYAQWEENASLTYTVTFDTNGGSDVASILGVNGGSLINKPTDPTKTNAKFLGWYLDNNTFENPWDFNRDSINEDITLYAKWEAVGVLTGDEEPGSLPQTGYNNSLAMGMLITGLLLAGGYLITRRKHN